MAKKLADHIKDEASGDKRKIRELERKLAQAKDEIKGQKKWAMTLQADLDLADKELSIFRALEPPAPLVLTRPKHTTGGEASAVPIACDWHCEERVDYATTNGKNKFNLKIADERIQRFCDKSILLTEAARSISNVRRCVLGLLGDFITGHIHEELAETNFLTPTKAVQWVEERLYKLISYHLEHGDFETIDVFALSGNHGRDTKKQRVSTRESHSYENLAYHHIAKHFAGHPKVRFHIADGILLYGDVQGWTVRFTHGDAIKFGGGIGGLAIPANKKIQQWDKTTRADYTYTAHWHQFLWQRRWIACPTLKGVDPYSIWIGAEHEPPAQLFSVIDSERGLTEVKPIFVDKA